MRRISKIIIVFFGISLIFGCDTPKKGENSDGSQTTQTTQTVQTTQVSETSDNTGDGRPVAEGDYSALLKCDPKEGEIDSEFKLGDLTLERQKELKFETPQTLAELDAFVEKHGGWIQNELRDDSQVSYDYLNGIPAPTTAERARTLRNVNEKENKEILHTLGRLPGDHPLPPGERYPEVDYEAEMVRHSPADASSFNPLLGSSIADFEVANLTGIALFSFTYDTFEPFVGTTTNTAWHSSKDHLVDKITLRDDITWSDGHKFTAYDIEFSYNLIMTSSVPVPAMRSGTDLLVNVKAYDEHTIVFFHEKAMPINIFNMQFSIIPKHIYEESAKRDPTLVRSPWHVQLEKTPVVAGPYFVEQRRRGQEVVLRKREGYWTYNGKPVREESTLQRIRIRISPEPTSTFLQLKKGDIEAMILTPELWASQTNTDEFAQKNLKVTDEGWTYFAFWWNPTNPIFRDKRVRQALSYAFDHEEMLKVHRFGVDSPCRGMFAESSPWFPKDTKLPALHQDMKLARKLLRQAGWSFHGNDRILSKVIDGKKVEFRFSILTSNKPDRIELCNLLRKNLRDLGIECTVQPLEFNVFMQKTHEKNFDACFSGWGAGADPYSSWNVWGTGEARNYISYSNPEVDRLFRQGEIEFDRAKRMAIYQKIHLLIYEDCPCTWLYNMNEYCGFNKKLRGLGFYARGPIYGSVWKEAQK